SPNFCCVPFCPMTSSCNRGLSFFHFPSNFELRQQWTVAIRRKNLKPDKVCFIFTVHFIMNIKLNHFFRILCVSQTLFSAFISAFMSSICIKVRP
uniref:THAP-type domain-containing protein n=1 Tax=Xiphophorus maculatus TaxID=8083 RepID=A0A3B5QE39_XIPMA